MFQTLNPADESVITDVHWAGAEDVERAVDAARNAFDHGPWRTMSAMERARIMFRYADLLEANMEELAALEALDNGKPWHVAKAADMTLLHRNIRYHAGWADKIHGQVIPTPGPFFKYTRKEAVGVCA